MDNKEKEFANKGCHFLSGTDYSPKGKYFAFTVTGENTVISDIDLDNNINTGDITAITLTVGLFIPIAGGFTKVKLSSGNMILYKDRD